MIIKKELINNWFVDEYCCEKMEHAILDEFIWIKKGQPQLPYIHVKPYLENGNYIDYCPFCGIKIKKV